MDLCSRVLLMGVYNAIKALMLSILNIAEIEPVAETEPVTGANERVPMAIERSGRQKFKLKPVGGIEKEWKSNKQLKRERKQKHKKKKKLNL